MSVLNLLERAEVLVLAEAGGAAARSAFYLLPKKYQSKVLAVDRDPSVGSEWVFRSPSVKFCTERELVYDIARTLLLPCDEQYRRRTGIASPLASGDLTITHHKARCYDRLMAVQAVGELAQVRLPTRLSAAVSRESYSSGGKGTQFVPSTQDQLLTAYLPFETEYVVDVFKNSEVLIYPRISHRRKTGLDTAVTLLGDKHKDYVWLHQAVCAIVRALGMDGVGNVQLGEFEGELYFIEAAQRLSGTAWVNKQVGGNPLLGVPAASFDRFSLVTYPV